MDESVRHLQDSPFQVSLGREGAVPLWVGMGWLATKIAEVPNPNTSRARYPLIKLPRAEPKTLADFAEPPNDHNDHRRE